VIVLLSRTKNKKMMNIAGTEIVFATVAKICDCKEKEKNSKKITY
jgi:hypothetical protein